MSATNIHQYTDYPNAFALGLTKVHESKLKQYKRTYADWLNTESVSRFLDTEWSFSGLGQTPEKAIGTVFSTDKILTGDTKQFSLTPYGLAVVIEYEAMKYEIYGIFKGLGDALARSAADRYMVSAYSILNNSFSAPNANYQTFQGENIISATHTRLDAGTWNNVITGNPGLSYLGVQQALIDLQNLVDERGFYGQMMPERLITNHANGFVATEILQSGSRPDQSNPAVVNTIKGELRIHTSPYVTSTTAWWITCGKEDTLIKLREGERPNLKRDSDSRTMNLVMMNYLCFGIAVFDSRGWLGSTG